MKRILSILLVILLLSNSFVLRAEETEDPSVPASAYDLEEHVAISANAVYLVNLDTGRVLYEKNADLRISPASTTKILSAALALEMTENPEETDITLPDDLWWEFEGIDISNAGLSAGETLSVSDLVHCMLLQSANEAASGIREYYGGSDFIENMNEKARSLGCTGSNFINPHGLYGENHYTTARDLFRITEWALTVPGFFEITTLARYTLPPTNKNDEKILATTILLQDPNSRYYTSYIHGIKTGTIPESGRCLVTTAEKNGMRFLLVLMGCPFPPTTGAFPEGNSSYNEARAIFDELFRALKLVTPVDRATIVGEVPLRYSPNKDAIVLYADSSLRAIVRRDSDVDPVIRIEPTVPAYVEAPIEFGQTIGTALVYADDILLGEIDLVSREQASFSGMIKLMDQITKVITSKPALFLYLAFFLLISIYLTIVILSIRKQAKRKKKGRSK